MATIVFCCAKGLILLGLFVSPMWSTGYGWQDVHWWELLPAVGKLAGWRRSGGWSTVERPGRWSEGRKEGRQWGERGESDSWQKNRKNIKQIASWPKALGQIYMDEVGRCRASHRVSQPTWYTISWDSIALHNPRITPITIPEHGPKLSDLDPTLLGPSGCETCDY